MWYCRKYLMESTNKKHIVIDGSRLSDIQSCYRRAHYAHNLHLRSKGGSEPLEKGTLMHTMLAVYYFSQIPESELKEHHLSHSLAEYKLLSRPEGIRAAIEKGREDSLSTNLDVEVREHVIQ